MKILIFAFAFLFYNVANSYEKGTIKIAYYESYFPFSYVENGKVKGLFIDIANYILEEKMHYKIISEAFPWERAQDYVKKGELDSHITLKTKERSEFLLFNNTPIFISQTVILYSINNPKKKEIEKIKSKNDLKKFIINDYIGNQYTKSNFPISEGFNIESSSNIEISLKKLSANRGDIVFISLSKVMQNEFKEKMKSLKTKIIKFVNDNPKYYLALRKNYHNSQEIINEFDNELVKAKESGELNKFFKKYNINQ